MHTDQKTLPKPSSPLYWQGDEDALLAVDVRNGVIENRYRGWWAISDTRGDIQSYQGNPQQPTFFRSAAKPFQALPLIRSGLFRELSSEELALTCASHSGSAEHLHHVMGILKKAGMNEKYLQCGAQEPTESLMHDAMMARGEDPRPIHNNCSGKHAGMLFYATQNGFGPASYLEPGHPLQQGIGRIIAEYGDLPEPPPIALDGCGAPTYYLSLATMALLYARLPLCVESHPLIFAMLKHPHLIGGHGRIDTLIMQAGQGNLIAKVGADGLICVSHRHTYQGLALKVSDGNATVRNKLILQLLCQLGWLTPQSLSYPPFATDAEPYLTLTRTNTQGRPVGEFRPCLEASRDPRLAALEALLADKAR